MLLWQRRTLKKVLSAFNERRRVMWMKKKILQLSYLRPSVGWLVYRTALVLYQSVPGTVPYRTVQEVQYLDNQQPTTGDCVF